MFFGGQLADRYFAQEKFLAFSHLIGGLAMLGLAYQKTFWPFFGLMLLHCFFYVPTMSVTNAIAFANIKDAQKDFGFIRVWGTVGWIAASWPLRLHPDRLGEGPSMDQAGGFVAWLGKALGTLKTGAGDGGGPGQHVHGRGGRVAGAGRVLPDLAAHTAAQEGRARRSRRSRRSSCWRCPASWCCSS